MTGLKTNEREGTRAVLRHAHISPYKVREVLDLVRGRPVHEAEDILRFSERDAAFTVGKLLQSAVANAQNNDEQEPEELYVSACYADEGTTIKRWRPRARGRATRIRKRTSHITIIVSRLPEDQLHRLQAHRRAEQLAQRARRVAGARRSESDTRNRSDRRRNVPIEDEHDHDHDHEEDAEATEVLSDTSASGAASGTTDAEVTDESSSEETDDSAADSAESETVEDLDEADENVEAAPADESGGSLSGEAGPPAGSQPESGSEDSDTEEEG